MTEIDQVCEKLYKEKIFPKVHAFKNMQKKKKKNDGAILHALRACYLKRHFEYGPWAYATKIIQIENGNYNEAEYRAAIAMKYPKEKRKPVVEDDREDRIAALRRQAMEMMEA